MALELPTSEQMQKYSEVFDKMCRRRWTTGAIEYGELAFIDNDIVRMLIEELIDTSNYARMQVMKLLWLEEQRVKNQPPEMGAEAFRGTGEGWSK